MPIYQYGSVNTAAQVVPDVNVFIVPPQTLIPNGAPTGIVGVVGTASWGAVGEPVVVGDMSGYISGFGAPQVRKFDAGTQVLAAVLQGASDFRVVRVSDGTDAAASSTLPAAALTGAAVFWTALAAALNSGSGVLRGASQLVRFDGASGTFSALYTGTVGNRVSVAVSAGSRTGTFRAVVRIPGVAPEVFDNIPADPAHQPTAATYTLAGGADGASGVTPAMLVGSDVEPRTGMYALREQGCSVLVVSDCDDSAQWTTIDSFALSEATYAIQVVPAGTSMSAAVAMKAAAGLDSYASKLMHGDWVFINDTYNGTVRMVSPQGFAAGKLAALTPNQSPLNKELAGIVGTQKSGTPGSGAFGRYSRADLAFLFQSGIDVISNPQPRGAVWGVRLGHNTSSNPANHGDAYTRMTNFLARSIEQAMGAYDGEPISLDLLKDVNASLNAFLSNLVDQKLLGNPDGVAPYRVVCNESNNPDARQGLGYVQANIQVRTQAINENFNLDLEDGPTVTIVSQQV